MGFGLWTLFARDGFRLAMSVLRSASEMPDLLSLPEEAALTLERLSPRLEDHLNDAALWRLFRLRLDQQFAGLFRHLFALYGDRYDFLHHLEQILRVAMDAMRDRPGELRDLDRQREADAAWFQDSGMVGGVCYVDLFAGDLQGVRERIPYLRDLGLTYLHLMPIFAAPEGENDGGYAVSDYRTVDPRLGTMEDLRQLAAEQREERRIDARETPVDLELRLQEPEDAGNRDGRDQQADEESPPAPQLAGCAQCQEGAQVPYQMTVRPMDEVPGDESPELARRNQIALVGEPGTGIRQQRDAAGHGS